MDMNQNDTFTQWTHMTILPVIIQMYIKYIYENLKAVSKAVLSGRFHHFYDTSLNLKPPRIKITPLRRVLYKTLCHYTNNIKYQTY